MNTVKLAKADPLTDSMPGGMELHIYITEDLPELKTLEELELFYQLQAETLADTLFNSLPQGTLDRLLIALMKLKTSLYRGKTNT